LWGFSFSLSSFFVSFFFFFFFFWGKNAPISWALFLSPTLLYNAMSSTTGLLSGVSFVLPWAFFIDPSWNQAVPYRGLFVMPTQLPSQVI